jgi:hypothetical protein
VVIELSVNVRDTHPFSFVVSWVADVFDVVSPASPAFAGPHPVSMAAATAMPPTTMFFVFMCCFPFFCLLSVVG